MMAKELHKRIIDGFVDSNLPQAEWTHEAHLIMALHFVSRHLPENILPLVRKRIRKLNDFHGTPNSDDSGYHETLTVFWLNTAFSYYQKHNDSDLGELMNQFIHSEEGGRRYPLKYYSERRLFSTKARAHFINPDIRSLDVHIDQKVVHHGHLTDQEFLESLENCSLDPSLFNHEAHLRLAWLRIHELGAEAAEKRVSDTIQNYVAHLGASDKYHHTLTIAAVKTVFHFYQKNSSENFFDFIDEFPRIKVDFKSLIDSHYSHELIQSPSARSEFLRPDLLEYS